MRNDRGALTLDRERMLALGLEGVLRRGHRSAHGLRRVFRRDDGGSDFHAPGFAELTVT